MSTVVEAEQEVAEREALIATNDVPEVDELLAEFLDNGVEQLAQAQASGVRPRD